MLHRLTRATVGLGLAVAAAGCGGSEPRAATPEPTREAGESRVAPRPQVIIDFARDSRGFAEADGVAPAQDSLRLTAGAQPTRAPLERPVEPGRRVAMVVTTIRDLDRLPGRAGVLCRGSADGRTGYELTIDRRERVRLERVQDGRRTLLAGYDADLGKPVPADAPVPLSLACGTGTGTGSGGGVSLAVSAGVRQPTLIRDPRPLPAEASTRVGLVAGGPEGASADFAAFTLTLGEG